MVKRATGLHSQNVLERGGGGGGGEKIGGSRKDVPSYPPAANQHSRVKKKKEKS